MPVINVGSGSIILTKDQNKGSERFADIYILTVNGHSIKMTDGFNESPPYDNADADWSPDGNHIIFTSLRDDPVEKDNTEIYTLEVANPGNLNRLTTSSFLDESPHWSGTANKIVFTSNRHNNGKVQIYNMNPDGSGVVRLTDNAYEDMFPRWKPDGSQIVFEREITRPNSKIFVLDADGTNEVNLTDIPGIHRSPAWSPDGSKIVFSSDLHNPLSGHFEIYTMDSVDNNNDGVGDNLNRVTNMATGVTSYSPSWYPDGSKILFVNSSSSNSKELYTVEPDGSNLTQITSDPVFNQFGGRVLA